MTGSDPRPVYTFFYDAFTCPTCGRRLEFDEPCGEDDDGPIYEGECEEHGKFLVQALDPEGDV